MLIKWKNILCAKNTSGLLLLGVQVALFGCPCSIGKRSSQTKKAIKDRLFEMQRHQRNREKSFFLVVYLCPYLSITRNTPGNICTYVEPPQLQLVGNWIPPFR